MNELFKTLGNTSAAVYFIHLRHYAICWYIQLSLFVSYFGLFTV